MVRLFTFQKKSYTVVDRYRDYFKQQYGNTTAMCPNLQRTL